MLNLPTPTRARPALIIGRSPMPNAEGRRNAAADLVEATRQFDRANGKEKIGGLLPEPWDLGRRLQPMEPGATDMNAAVVLNDLAARNVLLMLCVGSAKRTGYTDMLTRTLERQRPSTIFCSAVDRLVRDSEQAVRVGRVLRQRSIWVTDGCEVISPDDDGLRALLSMVKRSVPAGHWERSRG